MNKIFMEKLKTARKYNNLTQKQLANEINISETGYASWEQGLSEPSTTHIVAICKKLDISADYLLGLEDETGHKYNTYNNITITGVQYK